MMRTLILNFGAALLGLLGATCTLQGQEALWTQTGDYSLSDEQTHYLSVLRANENHFNFELATVNSRVLRSESFSADFGFGIPVSLTTREKSDAHGTDQWDGTVEFEGRERGKFVLIRHNEHFTGHFTFEDRIFRLKSLGGGLHVTFEVDGSPRPTDKKCVVPEPPEGAPAPPSKEQGERQIDFQKSSGECRWRILVGYTPAALADDADILSEIMTAIALANQAFATGELSLRAELAHAYQVDYDESGKTSTQIMNDWTYSIPPWNVMTEVHDLRTYYRADNCALIISNASDNPGAGWTSLAYSMQFSFTRLNRISAFTFNHELGHNALCTHDLENDIAPGSAPYAGYNNPLGCFSTIMSYGACASDALGNCPRINAFSRGADQTLTIPCDGDDLTLVIGADNRRNRDRLALSTPDLLTQELNYVDLNIIEPLELGSNEAAHFAAKSSVNCVALSGFELKNGSVGSFRAGNEVTLNLGFHARAGSVFTAKIGYCPNLEDMDGLGADIATFDHEDSASEAPEGGLSAEVFPNPFTDEFFLRIGSNTARESDILMTVTDLAGRMVTQRLFIVEDQAGETVKRLNLPGLSPGIYLLSLRDGTRRATVRIVKQ